MFQNVCKMHFKIKGSYDPMCQNTIPVEPTLLDVHVSKDKHCEFCVVRRMQSMLLILHGSNAGMQTAERRGMGPCKCKHSRGSLAEGHDTSEPAPSLCLDPGTSRPVDSSVSLAR
jgi:hypothetical protein